MSVENVLTYKKYNLHLDTSIYKWFAVKTKYKCEKYVAENLKKKGIEVYLPTTVKVKKYERKIKNYEIPLIYTYVFVKIIKNEYVKVLSSEYVKGFIKQNKELIAIPLEEIELLKRVVGEGDNIKVLATDDFVIGKDVQIVGGNLTGMTGKIAEIKGKKLFVLTLENMGLNFKMEIDHSLLSPI